MREDLSVTENMVKIHLNNRSREFKDEINKLAADFASRNISGSTYSLRQIRTLCSKEIEKRVLLILDELLRHVVSANLFPTIELQNQMKEILRRLILPTSTELKDVYIRFAKNVSGNKDLDPKFEKDFTEAIAAIETNIDSFILESRRRKFPQVWEKRELPILQSIEKFELEGCYPSFKDILNDTNLDQITTEFGVQALIDGNFITGLDARTFGEFDYLEIRLLPEGRRVIGQWAGIQGWVSSDEKTRKEGPEMDENLLLFISHSSKDIDVAEAIIELLRSALNLSENQIRCTSVNGYRLSIGADTNERLRKEIFDAKIFIGLISHDSLDSYYVMFELGARWGAKKFLAPLLCPGVKPSILFEPLKSLNALSCSDSAQLLQFVDDIGEQLGIKSGKPAAFQKYIDKILTLPARSNTDEGDDEQNSFVGCVG